MDYTKLNNDFEEASKATCENILDILHDIVRYCSLSVTYWIGN